MGLRRLESKEANVKLRLIRVLYLLALVAMFVMAAGADRKFG